MLVSGRVYIIYLKDFDEAATIKMNVVDPVRKRVRGTLADVLGSRENETIMVGLFGENMHNSCEKLLTKCSSMFVHMH